jgi:hypothetical protein
MLELELENLNFGFVNEIFLFSAWWKSPYFNFE